MQFERSIFIRCPVQEVFRFLRDKHLYRQKPGSPVLLLEKTSPGPVGVGSEFREVVQMFPFVRGEIRSTVTRCEPSGILAENFRGAGMRGWLAYEFNPQGDGTLLVQKEKLKFTRLMRPLTPLLMRMLLPRIEQRLEGIRMELEDRRHCDDPRQNPANKEDDPPA